MLEGWLDYHRATLLAKCAGLNDEQRKRRPVGTSLMSLHGLVRHLASVEHTWLRGVLQRRPDMPAPFSAGAAADASWAPLETADWAADLATGRPSAPRPGRRPPRTAWTRCLQALVAAGS